MDKVTNYVTTKLRERCNLIAEPVKLEDNKLIHLIVNKKKNKHIKFSSKEFFNIEKETKKILEEFGINNRVESLIMFHIVVQI